MRMTLRKIMFMSRDRRKIMQKTVIAMSKPIKQCSIKMTTTREMLKLLNLLFIANTSLSVFFSILIFLFVYLLVRTSISMSQRASSSTMQIIGFYTIHKWSADRFVCPRRMSLTRQSGIYEPTCSLCCTELEFDEITSNL